MKCEGNVFLEEGIKEPGQPSQTFSNVQCDVIKYLSSELGCMLSKKNAAGIKVLCFVRDRNVGSENFHLINPDVYLVHTFSPQCPSPAPGLVVTADPQ